METWTLLRGLDADRPWVLDSVLAALLFAGATLSAAVGTARPADGTYLALVAAGALPYVARRRWPLAVLLVATVPVLVLLSAGYTSAVIGSGLFLAAYSVAAWSTARRTGVAVGWVVGVLVLLPVVAPERVTFGELATNGALFAGAIALGRGMQDRRRTADLMADRARLVERARAEATARAVSDERLRIAQELHDVVGHSLGVIALQAGVGAHVIDSDPDEARATLEAVRDRSRAALAEVRGILGALRDDGSPLVRPPALAEVAALVAELREAGQDVDLRVEGDPSGVPVAVSFAAYRVVQEALTNVVRHAPGARAVVTVRCETDQVYVEVVDDGEGDRAVAAGRGVDRAGTDPVHDRAADHTSASTSGLGIVGMRERVSVWGGALDVGPSAEGTGFTVRARLPLDRGRSASTGRPEVGRASPADPQAGRTDAPDAEAGRTEATAAAASDVAGTPTGGTEEVRAS